MAFITRVLVPFVLCAPAELRSENVSYCPSLGPRKRGPGRLSAILRLQRELRIIHHYFLASRNNPTVTPTDYARVDHRRRRFLIRQHHRALFPPPPLPLLASSVSLLRAVSPLPHSPSDVSLSSTRHCSLRFIKMHRVEGAPKHPHS